MRWRRFFSPGNPARSATVLACACFHVATGWSATFDSASIKSAKPDARGYSIRPLPGRLVAENVTLKLLIAEAYHVYEFQVSGPNWIDRDRYDLEGKAGAGSNASRADLRQMLQALLAERFALKLRHDTKAMPVFALETEKGRPAPAPAKRPDGPVVFRVYQRRQITAQNAPLSNLTEALTWLLGRPVLDRTGLEGSFDYQLE